MDIVFERRGSGPPLVLLHGIGHRRQAWDPVIDMLAPHRDVIALDLPGFGASPALPEGSSYTMATAMSVMERFFAKHGLERPHVAGNSLGGLYALEAAEQGLARTATALSPAGFFNRRELRYATTVLRACRAGAGLPEPAMRWLAGSTRRRALMFGFIYGHPDRLSIDALIGDAQAMRGALAFEPTLKAGRGVRFNGTAAKVPVTIAWGTRDRLLRPRQAIRAQQRLPHARFVWLNDCGHVPMGDDPRLVADVLLEGSSHG